MVLGSLMLFKSPAMRVSLSILIPAVLATAAFFIFAIGLALKAQTRKATTGNKGLVGEEGITLSALKPEGQVSVHGEVWKASAEENIPKGVKVEVVEVKGLTIRVRPAGKSRS